MVRTRTTGQGGRQLVPAVVATRGRGCGHGRGRGRAATTAPVDPRAAPAQDQAPAMDAPVAPVQPPAVPIMILGLQDALAQILSVCTGLAQAVSATTVAATSQVGGGNQTLAAPTPEQVVQGLQTLGHIYPSWLHLLRTMWFLSCRRMSNVGWRDLVDYSLRTSVEQRARMTRAFLDKCQRILCTVDIW
uniref:Uncharacterized protein n=1 Tax=Nicotiana tabacum TaxID=4097 RepID=A0A1S4DGR4_TOBAC|nr:PREDICTED: uncharacterized protein LOC107829621 [Nicotiana tabacum]